MKKNICIAFSLLLLSSCSSNQSRTSVLSYEKGIEAFKNAQYEDAMRILLPIAKSGNPNAQFAVALMYKEGKGTSVNEVNMVKWLIPSAKANNPNAQELLATAYGMGKGGLEMSTVKAEFWYCLAATNGLKSSMYALGRMMSGTKYYLERKKYFDQKGYQHQLCNLAQLVEIDQSLGEIVRNADK